MTREELMKMSKKDLKARLVALNKEAQAKAGEELQKLMDEAKEISGLLADVANREALAGMMQDGIEPPELETGEGEEGGEPRNQERKKSGKALRDGKKVRYKAKTMTNPMNTLTTTSGVVMPKHTSSDIAPAFNDVSSLIDRVHTVPLPGGESYQRPFVKSYGDGAGSTEESADYNESEPTFGYSDIAREKITAYAEEPEELLKLPDADYDGVVEESVVRAIKRYASRQILKGTGGTGKFRGIFYNPEKETDDIIDCSKDIEISVIDDGTLDDIIYSYGGDEDVEDIAVLILNKKDLKKFAKLRDKQGRKVYTIVNHGNTGTIDEVPYIINSACGEVGENAGEYCMAYGPLSNYEVAIFSDIDAQRSTEYKFKQGQIAYKACVFMGGNVVAKNGFIRVKTKTETAAK